jgi:hypothetical protein
MMQKTFSRSLVIAVLAAGLLSTPILSLAQSAVPEAPDRKPGEGNEVSPGTKVIEVVLDAKSFVPIDIYHNGADTVQVMWRGCKAADIMSKLKKTKPAFITREPRYRGAQQFYGQLTLGNRKNNRYHFVMDVEAPDKMTMYFDFKNNGHLDESPPLANMSSFKSGENGYGTLIEMPWEQLIENSPFTGTFGIWFFINSFQWSMMGFSHASHTQLKGKIDMGGVQRDVVVADRAENDNDGDLTNDGLYLKQGAGEPLYISDQEARTGVTIGQQRYVFRIRYGAAVPPSPQTR